MRRINRRACLRLAASLPIAASVCDPDSDHQHAAAAPAPMPTKSVAAAVTIYRAGSHADVIVGKILEGWKQDGGKGPALKLAGVYIDQFPNDEMGRAICAKYGVPIFDSIEKAITLGQDRIAVDGVISIGEHGDYPINDFEQQLYPRRRFFAEIADTFRKHGRVIPVFNDKHLGPVWDDAIWMYQRARQDQIPLMAGSSMPVGYRRHEIDLPMGSPIEAAVGVGYSGLDIYGIHALELYQYHVERRLGAEQGVRTVRTLRGDAIWDQVDSGDVPADLLDAALATISNSDHRDIRQDETATLFTFEYIDGFRGSLLMVNRISGTSVALRVKGQDRPLATAFDERTEPRHPHFAYLLKAIERMIHTGRPTYPVERTLLTGGILDAALHSLAEGGVELRTPHLAIPYRPVDYPYAQRVDLDTPPLGRG
jgi:hypothetical protein